MLLQQILAIFLVLALLVGTLLLLRRKGLAQFQMRTPRTSAKARQMQVLERIPLSAQHSLHLVHVRNDVFLIGVSPSGCRKIASFPGREHAE